MQEVQYFMAIAPLAAMLNFQVRGRASVVGNIFWILRFLGPIVDGEGNWEGRVGEVASAEGSNHNIRDPAEFAGPGANRFFTGTVMEFIAGESRSPVSIDGAPPPGCALSQLGSPAGGVCACMHVCLTFPTGHHFLFNAANPAHRRPFKVLLLRFLLLFSPSSSLSCLAAT